MSRTIPAKGFTSDMFEEFLSGRDEPDWLVLRRRAAWKLAQELPMPSRSDEEWSRTDIRTLHLDRYAVEQGLPGGEPPHALLAEGVELAGRSLAVNSQPQLDELSDRWSRAGVIFGSLDRLVAHHEALVRENLLTRAVDPGQDKFAALHAAFWSGGTLLYVPSGVVVDQPLHMLSAIIDGGSDFGHTLIILDEGAEATLLAETASGGISPEGFHCGAVEILMRPGSCLRYVNLQNWGTGVWHFAHQKAVLQGGARIQWTIGALGSKLAKVNQHVALVEPGSEAQVNGVMFTEGKQHLSYHTLQHHGAPSTKSDLLYKAALQDHARTVWRGMIKVDPGALKSDGYQRNDNLMLSADARADSIPGLEIEADDVRCTHGSTTGRVDEEQVFYARCRGLTRNEAIRMIVAGFFQQVFDRITIERVRDALGEAIGRRIRHYR